MMNIVLKNSLKNIFGKPFRTLLVVFSIFVCCLCALLCFDLSKSISDVLVNFMGSISRADFLLTASGSDVSTLPDGFPEADLMTISANKELLYKGIDGEFCYVTTDQLTIYGLNIDDAVSMQFMYPIDIKDDEIYLTKAYAEDNGYKVGDKITLHDRAKEEVELTVGGILASDQKNPLIKNKTAVVNLNTSYKLSCGDKKADLLMIDLKDNSKIEEAKKMIQERYPDAVITDLFLSESDMAMINEFKAIFYLLFVVTFLLVIFVTASICNRIVSERMSYIGTLRSIGMSASATGRILLLENVLYALMGSIPATILYSLVRLPILNTMFVGGDGTGTNVLANSYPDYPIALVIGVILGAVLIECLIPLNAILKALKTSIRDIIFDNRDTEYKFSKKTLIIGLIFLAVAVPSFFLRKNLTFATICLVSCVAALALLFPRILKLVTTAIRKIADKHDKSAWSLAAVEAISRKSTVGSGVLCATAAAMCIIVYALSGGLTDSMSVTQYSCDVVMETSKDDKYYTYIDHLDGVTDVETIYSTSWDVSINDSEQISFLTLVAFPEDGFKYYNAFNGLPDTLEDGCVCLDKKLANRKGLKEGDTIKITYNPEGVLPIEREYKISALIENSETSVGYDSVIITKTEFKTLFREFPGMKLIKSNNPEATKSMIETYGKGSYTSVKTLEEIIEDEKANSAKTVAIVTAIIVIALGMTGIGMISNQLIGFEGRKKECAVMLSTAMSRGKLAGVLVKEVLITSITASGTGTLAGTLLTLVLKEALANAQTVVMDIEINPVHNLIYFALMTIIFTGTVLFQLKNLRKMKISEQIKYE